VAPGSHAVLQDSGPKCAPLVPDDFLPADETELRTNGAVDLIDDAPRAWSVRVTSLLLHGQGSSWGDADAALS
jgi:hypothetical protein